MSQQSVTPDCWKFETEKQKEDLKKLLKEGEQKRQIISDMDYDAEFENCKKLPTQMEDEVGQTQLRHGMLVADST